MTHVPVLLHEAVAALDIKPQGVYVDGTMGGASSALTRTTMPMRAPGSGLRRWRSA